MIDCPEGVDLCFCLSDNQRKLMLAEQHSTYHVFTSTVKLCFVFYVLSCGVCLVAKIVVFNIFMGWSGLKLSKRVELKCRYLFYSTWNTKCLDKSEKCDILKSNTFP